MGIHYEGRLLAGGHIGAVVCALSHERMGVEGYYPGRRALYGGLHAVVEIDGFRFCVELCHSGRTAGRRGLPYYGAFKIHRCATGYFHRDTFCHDAHFCPFLVLGDGCRGLLCHGFDGGCADK